MKKSTKILLVILGLVIIGTAITGIYRYHPLGLGTEKLKNDNPIVVGDLTKDTEKILGTIVYPGVNELNLIIDKSDTSDSTSFQVKDSPDGVANIYAQDLLNRYPTNEVSRYTANEEDSINGKATIISSASPKGKLTVTTWSSKNGLTSVRIEKSNTF